MHIFFKKGEKIQLKHFKVLLQSFHCNFR